MCLYIHIGRKIITIKTKASACARLWISSTVRREGVVDGPWVCKARARLPNLSENIANVDYNNTICIYYICTLFPRRVNEIIYTAATASYIIYIYKQSDILIFIFTSSKLVLWIRCFHFLNSTGRRYYFCLRFFYYFIHH